MTKFYFGARWLCASAAHPCGDGPQMVRRAGSRREVRGCSRPLGWGRQGREGAVGWGRWGEELAGHLFSLQPPPKREGPGKQQDTDHLRLRKRSLWTHRVHKGSWSQLPEVWRFIIPPYSITTHPPEHLPRARRGARGGHVPVPTLLLGSQADLRQAGPGTRWVPSGPDLTQEVASWGGAACLGPEAREARRQTEAQAP